MANDFAAKPTMKRSEASRSASPVVVAQWRIAPATDGGRWANHLMNVAIACALLIFVSGCSETRSHHDGSVLDVVRPGEESNWANGYSLRVENRTGNLVEDVRITLTTTNNTSSTPTVFTAVSGRLSQGSDADSLKLTLFDVRFGHGDQVGLIQEMPLTLRR